MLSYHSVSIMPSRSILIHISQVYILTSSDVPHQSLGFGFGVCSCKLCLPSIMYSHWFAFHISHNISHLVCMSFDLHNVGFKPCMLYVISFLSSVFLYISILCLSSRHAHHIPCVCIVWASFACLKSVLTAFLCRFKAPCLLRGLLLHALVQTPHRVGVSSGMFLSVLEASSIGNGVVCFWYKTGWSVTCDMFS